MMKNSLSIFMILALLLCFDVQAQSSRSAQIGKFGAAFGFSPVWMFPNVDELNSKLNLLELGEISKSGVFALGVSGYAYVLFIENLRIGAMSFGGSSSVENVLDFATREAEYSIGGWGVSIEYTLPFVKNVNLSVGAILGRGNIEINVFQNSGSIDWDDVWNDYLNSPSESKKTYLIENNYYTISPTINLDVPINRFLSFRAGGGYQFTLGEDWEYANEIELKNVPNNLSGNSFFVQTGVYLGFLAF